MATLPPKDPMQLLQELMRGGGQTPVPGSAMQGQQAAMPDVESSTEPPSDEEMLDSVHNAMGKRTSSGPPPGSGMKWENLAEDQAALQAAPTPENIAAFVDYWGRENLPDGVQDEEANETTPDNEQTE